jgi:methyl-accepting chemotaxis protein
MRLFRFRLQGQLLSPILIVVAVCTLALQAGSYWKSSQVLEGEVVEALGRDRASAVRAIDEWFENKVADLTLWSQDERFSETLNGDEQARLYVEQFTRRAKQSSADIKNIALANSSGVIVASSTSRDKVTDVSQREYFKTSMQGKVHISKPLISKNTGRPLVMLTAPIKDAGGTVLGVLMVVTEFEGLYKEVLAPIHVGSAGYAFAVDGGGLIIAHPDGERVMKQRVADSEYGTEMLTKKQGVKEYCGKTDGQRMIMVFGTTNMSGWRIAVTASLDELLAPLKATRNMAFLGALCTILLTGSIIFFVIRSVTKALKVVVDNATLIAEGGVDIDVPASLSAKQDEMGELGRAFIKMAANLKQKMAEIIEQSAIAKAKMIEAEEATAKAEEAHRRAERAQKEGTLQAAMSLEQIVAQVASASDELHSQIQECRKGADVQRERVTETASAMEQMNATVLEVAGNAANAAENADNARTQAQAGEDVVTKVTESIGMLSREAETLQGEMKDLGRQAQAIGQIMTVISDIADQTNLLALNAAIEAARAGDAGRGFAVVADEVRKLAEKTMSATQEVGNAIGAIQSSASKSIHSMEQTAKMVDKSTELTGEARQSLSNILGDVAQTADQVRAIATASEEQSAATEQISRSAEEINMVAMETADAMEQSAIAITELARLSDKLRVLVDEMKQDSSATE